MIFRAVNNSVVIPCTFHFVFISFCFASDIPGSGPYRQSVGFDCDLCSELLEEIFNHSYVALVICFPHDICFLIKNSVSRFIMPLPRNIDLFSNDDVISWSGETDDCKKIILPRIFYLFPNF